MISATPAYSRDDLVSQLSSSDFWGAGCTVIESTHRGNSFYAVIEQRDEAGGYIGRYIAVGLMRGHGHRGESWSCKLLTECDGPYAVDCPLRYLTLAGNVGLSAGAAAWRQQVRDYHALQRAQRACLRALRPGHAVILKSTCNPRQLRLVSRGPGGLTGRCGDSLYRVPPRLVDIEATSAANATSAHHN